MDTIQPSPAASIRPGGTEESQWRPVLLGAVAAMVVSGMLISVVAGIGTTVAQLSTVMAAASTATRHAPAYALSPCGLASR